MKRKNKPSLIKKLLKTLPVLVGGCAVIYLAVLIKNIEVPTVLPVSEVQVSGELNFINKKEIELLVKENISGGYFTIDLANIRELLMQKPWVKNVSLRRKWPASLNVIIEEQIPVAYWNKNAFLSEKGDVFKPTSIDKRLNLPGLNGPQGQHHLVWQFMNVLYRETALLNYEVVHLTLDERRAWQLLIVEQNEINNNLINVRLGRFDTEKRLQRFVRILPALSAVHGDVDGLVGNKIKVIDMRYPNGFAVKVTDTQNFDKQLSHVVINRMVKDKAAINRAVKNRAIINNRTQADSLAKNNNNNSRYFVCSKDVDLTKGCEA